MTPDHRRLLAQRLGPRVVRLHRALARLASPVSFMQSGAHPDDETSGMLAALGVRDGLDLAYVCATRGEGGQNDVGREAGPALGALRTAEMERAADALGMRLRWLSRRPEEIHDFGFSKDGADTLARWGRDLALARFVMVLRAERPDVLCPTFLDVPGQHGHHRAMTRLAFEAVDAAADPGFDAPGTPWRTAKLVLPAWSGAGQAYDDAEPPPAETFRVEAGADPVTGWSWEAIGQHSRMSHATQGMGRWPEARPGWPLHLAVGHVGGAGAGLLSGLPGGLGDLGVPGGAEAQEAMDAARAAWPDADAVVGHAARALALVRRAAEGLAPEVEALHGHRLSRKTAQLSRVLAIAVGAEATAHASRAFLRPGETIAVAVEAPVGRAEVEAPEGWAATADGLRAGGPPTDPYPDAWDPDAPRAPRVAVRHEAHGVRFEARFPIEPAPILLPERGAALAPSAALVNRAAPGPVPVALADLHPEAARPALAAPGGWGVERSGARILLTPPADAPDALHEAPLTLDGAQAMTVARIEHPHAPPRALAEPAVLRLRVLRAALPDVRVGHVSGGSDRVGHWMRAMGLDVADLAPDALTPDALAAEGLGAVVLGHFAVRSRGLAGRMAGLRAWVEGGGTLVTLYHRPWDDWDPDATPPRRLEIGRPSLRFRVTDEAAPVAHLAPDHPVLTAPNAIGPPDWEGWDKERGLYFARAWDRAYTPLLRMADPGEAPLDGALLSAEVGAGRHTHCALILHHQMERLVPGAFRLMANLVAPRTPV